MNTPLFFYSDSARQEMFSLVSDLPSTVEVYLVGGAVRNALIRKYHHETWRQRDYDQIVTNGSGDYFAYLAAKGFRVGELDRPTQRVMVKPVKDNPKPISYEDNLVLDIHMEDGTTIQDNLRTSTALLINGFALSLRHIFDDDWEQKLIQNPGAHEAIQHKRIRINPDGYQSESNTFFACMRFISAGFAAPPMDELLVLFRQLPQLETERYQRNLIKLADYVGSQALARQLVRTTLGSDIDIFDEATTKAYAASL